MVSCVLVLLLLWLSDAILIALNSILIVFKNTVQEGLTKGLFGEENTFHVNGSYWKSLSLNHIMFRRRNESSVKSS